MIQKITDGTFGLPVSTVAELAVDYYSFHADKLIEIAGCAMSGDTPALVARIINCRGVKFSSLMLLQYDGNGKPYFSELEASFIGDEDKMVKHWEELEYEG